MPEPAFLLEETSRVYRPAILERLEQFLAILPPGGFPHENGNIMTLVRRYCWLLDASAEWQIVADRSLVTVRLPLALVLTATQAFLSHLSPPASPA